MVHHLLERICDRMRSAGQVPRTITAGPAEESATTTVSPEETEVVVPVGATEAVSVETGVTGWMKVDTV